MPAVVASGAGVHVEAVQFGIELNEEDVRMTANEKPRWIAAQFFDHVVVVARWSASYVRHPHANATEGEALVFLERCTGFRIIDVAPYCTQRFPFREFIGHV